MAEISKFFNSAPGDLRTYQASDFADYFGNVLSSGLLHTDNIPALEVKCEGTDLKTYVEPGKAIIDGYGYENTSNLYLTHALPEATLDRIDRIVLRLDKRNQSRFIKLFVLQGTASATPVAPTLQRDEFIYELSLAQIRVRSNTSTLNPADLIDERLDENLCGLVYSLISIPTSQFQAEWDTFMAGIQDSGFATNDSVQAVDEKVLSHSSSESVHGIGDKSTLLTTSKTSIVSALNELFTNANNGKTDIASVVGSPATSGDTFAQLKTHIQNSKNDLATNLTAKGQSSVGTETLDALVDKVALVSTGRKYASGTVTGGSTLTVTGLTFQPSTVIVRSQSGQSLNYQTVYSKKGDSRFNQSHFGHQTSNSTFDAHVNNGNLQGVATKGSSLFAINASGFVVTYPGNYPTGTMEWEAYE